MKIKLFNKNEFKIFITFFLIFVIFIQWTGWVEDSYFALTRSIVDYNSLNIDEYKNTFDRSFYNGHYYSNKAPGLSFLATPVYAVWKFIYYNFFPEGYIEDSKGSDESFIANYDIVVNINPGFFVLTSMILITVFTSCLFSALTAVLIYKISKYFTKKEKYRLIAVITYGLGSLAFPLATVFMGQSVGTFFGFLAFYLLFKVKKEKIKDNKYFILAGLAGGFAVVCEYMTVLILLGSFLYTFSFKKLKKSGFFFLGLLIGLSPLLIYNLIILGSPFHLTLEYLDPFPDRPKTNLLEVVSSLPNPFITLRLLFYPFNGLFFYYPILFVSLLGLWFMKKEYKYEAILIFVLFFLFLLISSTHAQSIASSQFANRYLLPTIPFLILPLLYIFSRKNIKFLSIILLISIFINILCLGEPLVITHPWSMQMKPIYEERINSFQILENPILDHYLPLFFSNGPKSRIVESFLDPHRELDIRNLLFSKEGTTPLTNIVLISTAIGFFSIKMKFLPLYLILIVSLIIWRKETYRIIKKHVSLPVFYIILISLGLLFFNISHLTYNSNWHKEEIHPRDSFRWMSQNATLTLFNPYKEHVVLDLNVWSFYKPRTLEILVNNQSIFQKEVFKEEIILTDFMMLKPGENIVLFHSKEGCNIINEIKKEYIGDLRCLSFAISDIRLLTLKELEKKGIMYENNWYDLETSEDFSFRWMSQNATLIFYKSKATTSKISFKVWSVTGPRTLGVFLNNESIIISYNVSSDNSDRREEIDLGLGLKTGKNMLKFYSKEGCEKPSELDGSNDTRCLSFAFSDMKLVDIDD